MDNKKMMEMVNLMVGSAKDNMDLLLEDLIQWDGNKQVIFMDDVYHDIVGRYNNIYRISDCGIIPEEYASIILGMITKELYYKTISFAHDHDCVLIGADDYKNLFI